MKWFGAVLGIAFSLCCSVAFAAPPDGNPLPHYTTWLANSLSGADRERHIPNLIWGFNVSPEGEVVTNSFWDEGGAESVRLDANGNLAASPNDTHAHGGHAACLDDRYWYLAYKDGKTFGIKRYDKAGHPAAFPSGDAYAPFADDPVDDGNAPPFVEVPGGTQEGQEIQGMVRQGDVIIVADARNNRIVVLDAATATKRSDWELTRPRSVSGDGAGGVFAVEVPPLGDSKVGYRLTHRSITGQPLGKDIVFPVSARITGIAYDAPRHRLLVCDNGLDKQIKIYKDLFRTDVAPVLAGTFGEQGGVYATNGGHMLCGAVGPLRFNDLVGVGADTTGDIYVGMGANQSTWGADVRKFSPAGKMLWRRIGLTFVNSAGADPGDDSRTILTNTLQFKMDWSKTEPGTEATHEAVTFDPARFPDDPRAHIATNCATVRRIGGKRFLFCSDMYRVAVSVYRFDRSRFGYIAVPCALFVSGQNPEAGNKPTKFFHGAWPAGQPDDAWYWVDDNGDGRIEPSEYRRYDVPYAYRAGWAVGENGDITQAVRTNERFVNYFACKGVRPNGVPDWAFIAPAEHPPVPFGQVLHARYYAPGDQMYISGFMASREPKNDPATEFGDTLVRYDNWSAGNRTPTWTTDLPHADRGMNNTSAIMEAGDIAGDYCFVMGGFDATIRVYKRSSGEFVGTIGPGPEVGKRSGWVDIFWGVTATRRANGEYILIAEEDWLAKIIVYRWRPDDGTKK